MAAMGVMALYWPSDVPLLNSRPGIRCVDVEEVVKNISIQRLGDVARLRERNITRWKVNCFLSGSLDFLERSSWLLN